MKEQAIAAEPAYEIALGSQAFFRFCARFLDMALFTILIMLIWNLLIWLFAVAGIKSFELTGRLQSFLVLCTLGTYWFAEAYCISKYATTIGKRTFGICLRKADGQNLSFKQAFFRGLDAWCFGLGFTVPIVCFFTLLISLVQMMKHGNQSWDRTAGYTLEFSRITPLRAVLGSVGACILALLYFLVINGLCMTIEM